jgi:hypothetical protein
MGRAVSSPYIFVYLLSAAQSVILSTHLGFWRIFTRSSATVLLPAQLFPSGTEILRGVHFPFCFVLWSFWNDLLGGIVGNSVPKRCHFERGRHNIRACLCDVGASGGMWVQILSRSCALLLCLLARSSVMNSKRKGLRIILTYYVSELCRNFL